ncbi:MAG: 50S ribosomal protein L1 [Deltaproteobacteria bacterium]|nr:50S ribosomal protein L1 [Deltaproteobacteria bacterium]
MAKTGKKYLAAREKVGEADKFAVSEALGKVVEATYVKFDETVDVAVRLGVDPKHADQMVRGTVGLPHGRGKTVRVVVFAKGEKEKEARDAGAEVAGSDDLIAKIAGGWMEFDCAIATPDMMGAVSKLGKILGPRGLMPNPKVGTVTFDVGKAVIDVKAGRVEFRVDKTGNLHVPIGKVSFGADKLKDNFMALMEMVVKAKPATSKGTYLKTIAVSSTMGPSAKIDPVQLGSLFR